MRGSIVVVGLLAGSCLALAACSSNSPATPPTDAGGATDGSNTSATDGATSAADGAGRDAGTDTGASASDSGPPDARADTGLLLDAGPPVLNACTTYVDATAAGADRTLVWGFGIAADPRRCLMIAAGQTVTWSPMSAGHPLSPKGGTTPTPIPTNATTGGVITFPDVGSYGYVCDFHPSMTGAILVVP